MKGATFFSGGGGVDIGMEMAGITPIIGIEYDDKIATVARNNGLNVKTANMLEIDASQLPDFDIAHFSPPCPQFSNAKQKGNNSETDNDISLANSIKNIIKIKQPKYITIENVWQYRKSQSWAIILNILYELGYGVSVNHIDFSDFCVPQKRKRMVVRAIKDCFFVPIIYKVSRKIGWYEAIYDLYEYKRPHKLTEYKQEKFNPLNNETLIEGQNIGFSSRNITQLAKNKPCFTLTATKKNNRIHYKR